MIRDRGNIKWTAIMLPEHVAAVKQELINLEKVKKPILDEDRLAEIEMLIHEGMEYNYLLEFKLFKKGFIESIIGHTHFIDYIKKEFRIKDKNDLIHKIPFQIIVDVQKV
ncbi:YolD-like family protein [Bacillus sp. Au-Bac7]|uniref:YolD-like family protein n=1 Tax=Bacillus sp. Au-Bac7 TaxID=2906458 RepID=UPI001E49F6BA|nr:YolD-like family protein [Bacillus sp. Au-Bac7]MCE4052042.1 YolD-like family protein [Bacillus sp. Au-Bac7]